MGELTPWRKMVELVTSSVALVLVRRAAATHPISSPTRLRIYSLVTKKPGLSLREFARRSDVGWGTARYHVMRLESLGLIATRVIGRRRACFATGEARLDLAEALSMLAESTCRRIALHLLEHPGTSILRVVDETGKSSRVLYYHVKRLVDAGLVALDETGTYRALRPTLELYAAIGAALGR